ncbi:hypothetical protein PITCH_A420091 [uncultured Desulfobacterium sp.]|uniref:Uncharacterized protein n=1 Tax=uncultured Desulfobacterium sp. TaxID=201089 RepID=A0A445N057_9BACT|nr:hypothetical protein PITCH_A420091 [uncultured Desulfobacterium sp.]
MSAIEKIKYRSRYFTGSGIIGTKAFVATNIGHLYSFSSKIRKALNGGLRFGRIISPKGSIQSIMKLN